MRDIYIFAYKLDNGEHAISRALTTVNMAQMKARGELKNHISVQGRIATIHVGFENEVGSDRDARRISEYAWSQIRGKEVEDERQQRPIEFIEQQALPFDIINTGGSDE